MLDARLHRAALIVLLIPALIVAAFSLRPPDEARTSSLAPDAFDLAAARADLRTLAAIPNRDPGSSGDRAAAQFVAGRLRAAGFRVAVRTAEAQTVAGRRLTTTVVATRTGFSQRAVVLAADRSSPGTGEAGLTGTAALLEAARVLGGRTLLNAVEVVSTGAGPGGALAGFDPGSTPVIAALVLGDLGSGPLKTPFVIPWAEVRGTAAPLAYERSVAAAVRSETGLNPNQPNSFERLARLMLPLTTTDQGQLVAGGFPAVTLSSVAEHGTPVAGADLRRLASFGRAALRVAGILDGAPAAWPGRNSAAIPVRDRILPEWALRLMGAAGITAALVAGIDGLARARRRGVAVIRPGLWLIAGWPPFLFGWLVLLLAAAVGLLGNLPESTPPVGTVKLVWPALIGLFLIVGGLWFGLRRPFARPFSEAGDPGPGVASALMLLGTAATLLVWAFNPLTAILLVPFINVAPWLCDPQRGPRRRAAVLLLCLSLLPLAVAVIALGFALGGGPLQLVWLLMLAFASGSVGTVGGLVVTFMLALVFGVLVLVLRPRVWSGPEVTTRGPITYAGPGSLGGTKSAIYRG